jgi:2-polyprenyl-3-methyl-5-hydroxy-6-metoxy-1,4-benzoquinol methylase
MKNSENQPNPLLDPFVPAMSSWALVTAVSSGIFDEIADGADTSQKIAERLKLDVDAVKLLLDILSCLGYVDLYEGNYRLTDVSKQTLTKESHHRLRNWVRFGHFQLLALEKLDAVVKGKTKVNLHDLMKSSDDLRLHQYAMAETAAPASDWVASQIVLPENRKLMLDIGGSHGIYSAAICKKNPPLKAEIIELSEMIDSAREVSHKLGTDKYVRHIEGDIMESELHSMYDLIFMGNLIHHIPSQKIDNIFSKIHKHINPGGIMAIWDFAETEGEPNIVSSAFSLFFYMTSGSKCYKRLEIEAFAGQAGFTKFSARKPPTPSPHILYIIEKE